MERCDDFFEILRCGLWGTPVNGSVDWDAVLKMANRQTVMGIVAEGVGRMEGVPDEVVKKLRAFMMRNMLTHLAIDRGVGEVAEAYRAEGIEGVLLKGQGVARYYDNPSCRQCGDIDYYIGPEMMDRAIEIAMEKWRDGVSRPEQETYKHFSFNIGDTEVELHRTAAIASRPWKQRKFSKWIAESLGDGQRLRHSEIGGVDVRCPGVEFDAVYIFFHAFSHLIEGEGVGLRQLCDWAMVLHRFHEGGEDAERLIEVIREFGLERPWQIMGGIVVDKLGLPKEEMPLYSQRYAKESARLLSQIMAGGNFGKHNEKRTVHKGFWGQKYDLYLRFQRNLFRMWYLSPLDVIGAFGWFTVTGMQRALRRRVRGGRPS